MLGECILGLPTHHAYVYLSGGYDSGEYDSRLTEYLNLSVDSDGHANVHPGFANLGPRSSVIIVRVFCLPTSRTVQMGIIKHRQQLISN
jgi:hypothetical protein